jgi:hypothetical protein
VGVSAVRFAFALILIRPCKQVPSYELMGISRELTSSEQKLELCPLGGACARLDLTTMHEILENTGYKDDEVSRLLSLSLSARVYACVFRYHISVN